MPGDRPASPVEVYDPPVAGTDTLLGLLWQLAEAAMLSHLQRSLARVRGAFGQQF